MENYRFRRTAVTDQGRKRLLFESDEPAPTIVKGTNGGSGGIGGKKPSEMTYSELCDYMEQNPGAEI